VRVASTLGSLPAWLVNPPRGRPRSATWAIYVHGRNSGPREGLRKLRGLRGAGITTLLITYRNDVGAPPSRDGRLHLGDSEWRDLEGAARFAGAHGAHDLVLLGDSMGGAIVTQFVERSRLARRVRALVLDSPVLDWREVLSLQASNRGLPGVVARITGWVVERRIGIDFDAFNQVGRTRAFDRPILLFHGTADRKVPISTSDAFARALPRLVTYRRVRGAGHVQSWNVNPRAYDRALSMFLTRVGAAGEKSSPRGRARSTASTALVSSRSG
jgi:pimeloyl-ACP methyl ester carboxylesterase